MNGASDAFDNAAKDIMVEHPSLIVRANFTLVQRGDTPDSEQIFDAIQALSVPVIVSDGLVLPFERFIR